MKKQILIFRHGETDWNQQGRFQGHADVPINPTGRLQARALIPDLERYGTQAILSSDLSRAYETARIAANALGIPVFSREGLREAHLGEAQGLSKDEIERRFGQEMVIRWRSSQPTDADVSYPGGESGSAIVERVFKALESFLHETDYERVGVATHGGVIRRVMHSILPPGSQLVPIPNGVVYLLAYDLEGRRWTTSDALRSSLVPLLSC